MNLTLEQAFKKGIEAQQSGQNSEADKFYRSILLVQPKHPEVNLNMGLLAASTGKVQEALPFFKIAFEAQPNVLQFRLAYIEVLIILGKLTEARDVFTNDKLKVINGEVFANLNAKLVAAEEIALSQRSSTISPKDPTAEECQRAVDLFTQGQFERVLTEANALVKKFPNSTFIHNIVGAANSGLSRFEAAIASYKRALDVDPNYVDAHYNIGAALEEKRDFEAAIVSYREALKMKPDYFECYLSIGKILKDKGDFDAATSSYHQALKINPELAVAYYNMGNILIKKDDFEAAIALYKKALGIDPEYADAYSNMGNAQKGHGDVEAAIASFNKALNINPDLADTHYNLANALQEQGKLESAIFSFKKALEIKPNYADCFIRFNILNVQLFEPTIGVLKSNRIENDVLHRMLCQEPMHLILQAISNFMNGNLKLTAEYLEKYKVLDQTPTLKILTDVEKIFSNAYFNFLSLLSQNYKINLPSSLPVIYHVGESHCLSYAHCTVLRNERKHYISPKVTFGAKAYHFSVQTENSYKAITKLNLKKIPSGSPVFVSIGEIDCRHNEGILKASEKTGRKVKDIIDETVEGYISWFLKENESNQHSYYFFNVPAPNYLKGVSEKINTVRSEVVSQFNASLSEKLLNSHTSIIDVYKYTKNDKGFSNNRYHCDGFHLDPRMLPNIQNQINAKI